MVDNIEHFMNWWIGNRSFVPTQDGVQFVGKHSMTTLFRQGQYQVQLCTCPPNSVISNHRHPNIDSFELYLGGDLIIIKNDERFPPVLNGPPLRLLPTDWHGGEAGPNGGSFLSIQYWIDKEPSSVHLNWEGEPIDEKHYEEITSI